VITYAASFFPKEQRYIFFLRLCKIKFSASLYCNTKIYTMKNLNQLVAVLLLCPVIACKETCTGFLSSPHQSCGFM
jgi:hypothetical protein